MNWLAVVVATLAFFAVGAIWYTALFGKIWQREVGLSDEQLAGGRNMMLVMGTCFVLEFIVCLTVGHMFDFLEPSDRAKMMITLGLALGVMAPAVGINYLYQRKSLTLFLVDAGHFLAGMAAVGTVFVALG
ncbi:MAG: DUF1761 domain-containing protein [Croceibacterium sp.]